VQWVDAALAGPAGVSAIGTGSVDLVFSGQNIEHLWPEQTVAFLTEANRVLKDNGLLVVDSPNRSITASYQWSMGEHTVELTPTEAEVILRLGGFDVERMKGLWLCHQNGRLLPLQPSTVPTGSESWVRRITMASERPQDSFIWWAEARKRWPPDIAGLRREITRVFESSWAERVARVAVHEGTSVAMSDGTPAVWMARGTQGYALIGPYMALPPGSFEFTLPVTWDGVSGETVSRLDVVANDKLLGSTELHAPASRGTTELSCLVTLSDVAFAVHIRLWCSGAAEIKAPLTLSMSPDPWR
jgi:hypothetical protein